MPAVRDSQLLCVHIADAVEVTQHVRAQAARIEDLEEENASLRARVLELGGGDQVDAAATARAHANSLLNRH